MSTVCDRWAGYGAEDGDEYGSNNLDNYRSWGTAPVFANPIEPTRRLHHLVPRPAALVAGPSAYSAIIGAAGALSVRFRRWAKLGAWRERWCGSGAGRKLHHLHVPGCAGDGRALHVSLLGHEHRMGP